MPTRIPWLRESANDPHDERDEDITVKGPKLTAENVMTWCPRRFLPVGEDPGKRCADTEAMNVEQCRLFDRENVLVWHPVIPTTSSPDRRSCGAKAGSPTGRRR
jgi:hypothetical protein